MCSLYIVRVAWNGLAGSNRRGHACVCGLLQLRSCSCERAHGGGLATQCSAANRPPRLLHFANCQAAWIGGTGCVPLHNLMEDAATAEISRAQVRAVLRCIVLSSGRVRCMGSAADMLCCTAALRWRPSFSLSTVLTCCAGLPPCLF